MIALLLCQALLCVPQAAARAPSGDELVQVTLIAERAALRPGERLRLGVQLEIAAGWHIYWINPGDSGFPTQATVHGPEGFQLGETTFPAPHRFEAPGDIVTYGYEGDVLLVVDVQAPARFDRDQDLRFRVEASWLVCAQVCIPGQGAAELVLPVARSDATARPHNERLFARWNARLPRPWSELEGAQWTWSRDESAPEIAIRAPGARVIEFFPLKSPSTKFLRQAPRDAALQLDYRFRDPDPEHPWGARGLLRVAHGNREAFYELDAPWNSTRSPHSE